MKSRTLPCWEVLALGNHSRGSDAFREWCYKTSRICCRKNTVSDYFPVEQEYGYSVFSTVLHVEWNNKNLILLTVRDRTTS